MSNDYWQAERTDILFRFSNELHKATGDGSAKRQAGTKPPWWNDPDHEAAIFSHITKWKRGELVDPDSGAHPLVHAAWRCLAIACAESGNVPNEHFLEAITTDDSPVTTRNDNDEVTAWDTPMTYYLPEDLPPHSYPTTTTS